MYMSLSLSHTHTQNCSVPALQEQLQAVQSLQELLAVASELQELVDGLPTFSNSSDQFEDLELFLCGSKRSDSGDLSDVLKRYTEGNAYRQGQLREGKLCIASELN